MDLTDPVMTMTVPEVSLVTRIGRNTIYEAVERGDLRSIRVGRKILVTRQAVERWLQKMEGKSDA